MKMTARTVLLAAITAVLLVTISTPAANAGSYTVAQCAPNLFPDGEPGYSTSSNHFTAARDCSQNAFGFQVGHGLPGGATGTERGRFGAWVWQAPGGTFITGGSVYSRLENDSGIFGFLAVSPDAGAGIATENQNDNQLHLSAIPAGNWRYFVARLECTQPTEGNRCVGPAAAAHTYVKQLFLTLTDVAAPSLSLGGSMFDAGRRLGRQTIVVAAGDQGAGLRSVQIKVNGVAAGGDDLAGSCNPLPGGTTSRLSPCPGGFNKSYTLDTGRAPFTHGPNTVEVCIFDYAQVGGANTDCETRSVLVDSLCPESPVGGGADVRAGFAGNGKSRRTLKWGKRALIRGRVVNAQGEPVGGAQVCILGHTDLPGRPFRLIGTATANDNGGWSYKTNRGSSRRLRAVYRDNTYQVGTGLRLRIRATSSLRISRRETGAQRKVHFSGCIPGRLSAERVVILYGTVPGAKRAFLVRRARTNATGCHRVGYEFAPARVRTKFVFWIVVPQQAGLPLLRGRSPNKYIWVRP
jgi:hypothetical protein